MSRRPPRFAALAVAFGLALCAAAAQAIPCATLTCGTSGEPPAGASVAEPQKRGGGGCDEFGCGTIGIEIHRIAIEALKLDGLSGERLQIRLPGAE